MPLLTALATRLDPAAPGQARREEVPFSSDYFSAELSAIRQEVYCPIPTREPMLPQREICVYLEPAAEAQVEIRCVRRQAAVMDEETYDSATVPVLLVRDPGVLSRIEAALEKACQAPLKQKAR
ncbi:MAG: hypothetical protein ACT4QC_20355 [Planctomycetaceae bacterium]